MMMRWLPIVLVLSLVACSKMPSLPSMSFGSKKPDINVDPTVYPKNYKQEIIQSLPQLITDIDGMQNPTATDPALGTVGTGQVYFVCVRGNPHVASTGSLGDKVLIAYFLGGKINQLVPAPDNELCAKGVYKPFPELASWCRGAACSGRR